MLGSIRAVTDSTGQVVASFDYEPFGLLMEEPGPASAGGERYTGKPRDAALGLYYFGARHYDPELGRFITADPAKDGLNWYAYCDNNPMALVDPDGLDPYPAWLNWMHFGGRVHNTFSLWVAGEGYHVNQYISTVIGKGGSRLRPDLVLKEGNAVLELKSDRPGNDAAANAQVAKYCTESEGILVPGDAKTFMEGFGGKLDLGIIPDNLCNEYRVTVTAGTGAALLYHAEKIDNSAKQPEPVMSPDTMLALIAFILAAMGYNGGRIPQLTR